MSTAHAPDLVRVQLERIASSKVFGAVPRSVRLLRFVVEETINGNSDQLKEYTLGAKALDRGDGFDPRIDPIVRAEVSRLRTRLALYYGTEGRTDPLVISLPKGTYVPTFEQRAAEPIADKPVPQDRRWKVAAGVLALALSAAAFWTWRSTRTSLRPLTRVEMELRSGGSLGSTVGSDIAISPDGTRLAFIAQDSSAVAHLYTLRLDAEKPVELDGTEGARVAFFSPDGQWIAFHAQGKLKKVPAAGGPLVVLCDAADVLGGSWGDDGNIIATLDTASGLRRIPSAGGEPVTIANLTPALAGWPQVLPGSSAVLFTTLMGGADGAAIEVLSLRDGSRKTVVSGGTYARYLPNGYLTYVRGGTLFAVPFDVAARESRGTPAAILEDVSYSSTFGYAHLAFSDTGTLVYRRSSSLMDIEWLEASGRTEPLLSKPAHYVRPRLSPEGRRLAYSNSDVMGLGSWIFDIEEKKTTHLDSRDGSYGQPLWTPDGRFLVLGGRAGTAWTRADGTLPLTPLTETQAIQMPSSFAPDGKRLAYLEFNPKTALDLWTVTIEMHGNQMRAGRPEPFLVTPAFESQAMFSPDGRWIAYCSTESGSWEIYVQPFPPNGTRVQVSAGGGRIPFWSSNGRDLFYATERQKLMRLSYVVRGGAFVPSRPVLWTERPFADTGVISALDLAPDGKRFAALMPAAPPGQQQAPNHVTLMLNFFDEVQRRFAAH